MSGWKRVARVVSPLTKTPPLKWISTLKSHLTLMLTQRKKKPEVGGMNPKMSVTAETLMRNQKKTRDLQEWEPQPSPPRHDPALPHLRRCLKGSARRHRPPPLAVKPGSEKSCECLVIFMAEGNGSRDPWMEGRSLQRSRPAPSASER